MSMSKEQTARMFGISNDQLERQYAQNLKGLKRMLAKAILSKKKVNGYTRSQLAEMVKKYTKLAGKHANK